MKEQAFRYGENNRGFGMMTLPKNTDCAPIIVMLNAGSLHRAEPYRLNVLACRRLSELGYICVRIDLSGNGDTPPQKDLPDYESLMLDWGLVKKSLEHQYGKRHLIILGLCSGADNGIKIAAQDSSVKGLILLDPVSKKDTGFARRELFHTFTNISKFISFLSFIRNRFVEKVVIRNNLKKKSISLRSKPREKDMQQCFEGLVSRQGRVLTIFTGDSLSYYNNEGQFCRAMSISGLKCICEECFWPNVDHLYTVQTHRDRLLDKISEWCSSNYGCFSNKPSR